MTFRNFHWLDLTKYAVTLLLANYLEADMDLFHKISAVTSNFKVFLNASFYFMSRNFPSLY